MNNQSQKIASTFEMVEIVNIITINSGMSIFKIKMILSVTQEIVRVSSFEISKYEIQLYFSFNDMAQGNNKSLYVFS